MSVLVATILAVIGALCGPTTILHTFAVLFDVLMQGLFWNQPVPVTISSRAGLAARKGNARAARVINFLAHNANHCEEAIAADTLRANEALAILNPKP
jgi:hypothetical protein